MWEKLRKKPLRDGGKEHHGKPGIEGAFLALTKGTHREPRRARGRPCAPESRRRTWTPTPCPPFTSVLQLLPGSEVRKTKERPADRKGR